MILPNQLRALADLLETPLCRSHQLDGRADAIGRLLSELADQQTADRYAARTALRVELIRSLAAPSKLADDEQPASPPHS